MVQELHINCSFTVLTDYKCKVNISAKYKVQYLHINIPINFSKLPTTYFIAITLSSGAIWTLKYICKIWYQWQKLNLWLNFQSYDTDRYEQWQSMTNSKVSACKRLERVKIPCLANVVPSLLPSSIVFLLTLPVFINVQHKPEGTV